MASASSPKLKLMFEIGSGDGVTAARERSLAPCAMGTTQQGVALRLIRRATVGRAAFQ